MGTTLESGIQPLPLVGEVPSITRFVDKANKPDSDSTTRRRLIGGLIVGGLGLIGLASRTDLPRRALSSLETPPTPEVSSIEFWGGFEGAVLDRIPEPNPDGILQGKSLYDSWVVYEPFTPSTNVMKIVSPYLEKPAVSEPMPYGPDEVLYTPHIALPTSITKTVELSINEISIELGPIQSGERNEHDYLPHTVSEQSMKDLVVAWPERVRYAEDKIALIDEQFPIEGIDTKIYYPTLNTDSQIVWDPEDKRARGALISSELLGHTQWNQIVDYITGKIVFVSAGGNNFQGLFNARTKNEQIIADGGSISDGKIATYPPYLEALRVKSNYFTKGQKEPNQESNSRFENSADLFAQMWIIASDQVQYWKLVQWWKENRDTNQGQITSLVSFWGGFNNIIESASNPEKLKSDALSYLTALNELMSIDNKSYSTHLPGLETGPDANIQ